MSGDAGEMTMLLRAMKDGDASAADRLLALVYKELHVLAAKYIQHFIGVAATVMRRVLVDHARAHNTRQERR